MKKVIYLSVEGKVMNDAKKATNNSVKAENTSISFCIKQVIKHDAGFLNSFVNYKESDLTPSNLLAHKKETEGKNGKFTAWLVMTLVRRMYASQGIQAPVIAQVVANVAKGETRKGSKKDKKVVAA